MDKAAVQASWKLDVVDRSDVVDPVSEHDWRSLALGYAIGKGMSIEQAQDFINTLPPGLC